MAIRWSINLKISGKSISFPCDYPIKVLCKNRSGLLNEIVKCISKHDFSFKEASASEKLSKEKNDKRLPLGVALGGGGARGAAHIGVLQKLKEAGIKIDIISG